METNFQSLCDHQGHRQERVHPTSGEKHSKDQIIDADLAKVEYVEYKIVIMDHIEIVSCREALAYLVDKNLKMPNLLIHWFVHLATQMSSDCSVS